jgi:hypothetical protein
MWTHTFDEAEHLASFFIEARLGDARSTREARTFEMAEQEQHRWAPR